MMTFGPELATALCKAQSEIEGAKKGKKNEHFRSKYADLASVWDACREALTENGLSVVQLPCEAPPGQVGLITTLLHSSGQSISEKFFMPLKDPSNPQAVGSALTYARRYALSAAVGVCPEDDDGNAAAAGPKPGPVSVKLSSGPDIGPRTVAYDRVKDAYMNDFAQAIGAKDQDQMKGIYTELRNSTLPEPTKTQLLSEFGNSIKKFQEKTK